MRIMGIDPGTRIVGFAILEEAGGDYRPVEFGAVRADPRRPVAERYLRIYEGLVEVIRKHRPDEVAVEKVFTGKSPQSSIRIGEGRGLALLAAASEGLPVSEYAPAMVKKSVLGNGAASKEQVQEVVRRLLGLREAPRPFDAADALAIAICHSHRRPG